MTEVQAHGFTFEKWVKDEFFSGYQGKYMDKWDVPAAENTNKAIPAVLRNLPVSVKTARYGSPIGLGDILRQRQINHPFLMIVGFWQQRSRGEKWVEEIGVGHFSAEIWAGFWGDLKVEHLQAIDLVVKNLSEHHHVVRQKAKIWKLNTPAVASSRIVVNPKIDSKTQRRIQCSLPFHDFWQLVERLPTPQDRPKLFGVEFPNPVKSFARTFNRS